MAHWERDKRIWGFLCFILNGWLRRKFGFTPEIAPPDLRGPCLVLANHTTNWDPLLMALSFRKHPMYFVASEHIFRWGFLWRVIDALVHPIARLKGTTAADTAMTILRRMRKGASVALFAEGNRTWDGVTGPILPSTAKLARMCGGTLVTYRLEGGYFSNPRWAGSRLRRGTMRGRIAGIYPPEQLRAMTPEQVDALIRRDLREDAWERQRLQPTVYRSARPAEGLQTMLCVCPRCGELGTLSAQGAVLRCGACGFSVRVNEYGFLTGDGAPADNLRDWDVWQTARLWARTAAAGDGPVFRDEGAALDQVREGHRTVHLGRGAISLSRTALTAAERVFPLAGISGMGMHGALGLSFTFEGAHYEVSFREERCLRKYYTICQRLREEAQGGKEAGPC